MQASALRNDPLFCVDHTFLSPDERVSLAYRRARLVLQCYDLSVKDVLNYSPKFWKMHLDPILPLDIACFTIIGAGINLTVGTLARYIDQRPDLEPLVKSMLRLETVGLYLLSERGHGLDAANLETTAHMTRDGFILHTPREEATKFMPATTPLFGIPKVALVMARLIVAGQDRGLRWFIVPICNEHEMYPGITSRRLPPRTGTSPLDFSLTSFDNLVLPRTALLGSSLETPLDPREAWWSEIWRIPLGSMAVSAPFVSGLKHSAYVVGKYSLNRTILGRGTMPIPIITFPTQQWPVLNTLAAALVTEAWFKNLTEIVAQDNIDRHVSHGLSVVAKTTICRHFQRCTEDVAERCGAQGTFENNSLARMVCDLKGIVIAEGDVLTLCVRLFSELLQERYLLPLPPSSDSLLAQHAHALLDDNIQLVKSFSGGSRSQEFQDLILPQAESTIAAFGHAMALSAAGAAHVPEHLLEIYTLSIIDLDPAWYLEHANLNKIQLLRNKASLMHRTLPRLHEYLDALGVADYVRASIVSDETLKEALVNLPTYTAQHGNEQPFVKSSTSMPMHVAKL